MTMTFGATSPSQSAWPEFSPRVARPYRDRLPAIAMGLMAAAGAAILLPAASFRAQTTVGVTNPASPYTAVLIRSAAARALSKPVTTLAAQSLNETGMSDPEPSFAERLALAFGTGGGRAASGSARLAADLSTRVAARAGDVPGSLQVIVRNEAADVASREADALAQALVKIASDDAAQAARLRERDTATSLEAVRGRAIAARKRLADLGAADADPAQMRADIAAQLSATQTRLDAIRNIIASGNPPLADRRDMPPTIEALQSTYLDLTRQLAKARETLGDRHTTIISLQEEVRHASAALLTEWRRLARVAEGELKSTRLRQSALPNVNAPAVIARRDALSEARHDVEMADAAFVRAQTAQTAAIADEPAFRVIAPAAVPATAAGLSIWLRGLVSLAAGLLAAMATIVARTRPVPRISETTTPVAAPTAAEQVEPEMPARRHDAVRSLKDEMMKDRLRPDHHRDRLLGWAENRLERSMVALLPRLDTLDAAFGGVTTIVVTTCEASLRTTSAAMALARAAAGEGRRVLLVEPFARRSELAALVDLDAEPVVLDFFGTLRVAIGAERCEDTLFLVPSFAEATEIAAALVRNGTAEMLDDLAACFDLVVLDAGAAQAAADAGWGGDAFLRVGTAASSRDDRRIVSIFDAPAEALLGAVVGGRLIEDGRPNSVISSEPPEAERPVVPRGANVRPFPLRMSSHRGTAPSPARARR